MRQFVLAAGTVALLAGGAAAQISEAGRSPWITNLVGFDNRNNDFYRLPTEDGLHNSSIGFNGPGTLAYGNRFLVQAGGETITHVSIAWGFNANGVNHEVGLWRRTVPGGPLTGMTLLSSANATGGVESDTFNKIDIPDVTMNVGDEFFVGFVASGSQTTFFGSWDNTAPHSGASFIWGTGAANAFTAANIGTAGLIGEIGAFGLAGDWLIRANGIPAPGALALAGFGGLAIARRRR